MRKFDKLSYSSEKSGREWVDTPEPLKPCPFCGGETNAWVCGAGYGTLGIKVCCDKCNASSTIIGFNCGVLDIEKKGWHYQTKSEAVSKAVGYWNRRKVGAAL